MVKVYNDDLVFEHDPNEELDYTFNWAPFLPTGDTIVSSTWIVPAAITQPVSATFSGTLAVGWFGFDSNVGTIGEQYRVTNRIISAGGRKLDRSFRLLIKEK